MGGECGGEAGFGEATCPTRPYSYGFGSRSAEREKRSRLRPFAAITCSSSLSKISSHLRRRLLWSRVRSREDWSVVERESTYRINHTISTMPMIPKTPPTTPPMMGPRLALDELLLLSSVAVVGVLGTTYVEAGGVEVTVIHWTVT